MKVVWTLVIGYVVILVLAGALYVDYSRGQGPFVTQPATPAPLPSVSLSDVRVRYFSTEPAELPVDDRGKLHVFCNAKRGDLIYVYESQLAIVRGACK